MIVYLHGDVLETHCSVIAHGVNCVGGFKSGVAGQIAQQHPNVRKAYLNKYATHGWKLADVQFVASQGKLFVNCATQYNYGRDARETYVDYSALDLVMKKLYLYCQKNHKDIAMPKIGAGLANGDWNEISKCINKVFHDRDIFVYVLDK